MNHLGVTLWIHLALEVLDDYGQKYRQNTDKLQAATTAFIQATYL